MDGTSWDAAYHSDLQSFWSLLVMPLAFLAWRAAVPIDPSRATEPGAAGFVARLTLFFAVATMVDPLCTGQLVRLEPLSNTVATTLVPLFFVLFGDLRVLLLAIGVARPDRAFRQQLGWAAGTTLIVPIASGTLYLGAREIWPDLHGQVLWMIYEAGFGLLCIFLSRRWLRRSVTQGPARIRYLRAVFGYSTAYYALWLIADALIVIGGLDLGWAIRMIPNQLYYAGWVPFVYWRFFEPPPNASA